ncbi:MAG: FMN reductase (NADPH) [Planctomycetota bacterium]
MENHQEQRGQTNDFAEGVLKLLSAHSTRRQFETTALPEEDVRRAVRAAQMASTSSNVQAYSLLRVRDPDTRKQLAQWSGGQAQVAESGAFFLLSADQRRHRLVAKDRGHDYAPNLETFLVAVIDASLFAQNLVVAFEALGYGICFIGGLRNQLADVDRLLELPTDVFPLFGLCVGVPRTGDEAQAPQARPRLPLEGLLAEERYPDDDAMGAAIAAYDATMRTYYIDRGQPGYDWSAGLARKFGKRHREHLRDFFISKGADLQ